MICPRCELGTLITIRFKENGKNACVCDVCEALWLEGEDTVRLFFSHTGHIFINSEKEYSIDTIEEVDQEHRPARYNCLR